MSISRHLISCITLSTTLLFASSTLWAQDYYKWVDAKGSTHYTTTPPPKSAQKKGKIQTYGWKNSAPAVSQSNSAAVESQVNNKLNPSSVAANNASNAPQAASTEGTKTTITAAPATPEIKTAPNAKSNSNNY